jgi:predicted nucleic acid-binding protein
MIILDTNVMSSLMRENADSTVVEWLDRQPRIAVWTTAVTVLEVQFGLAIMPDGRRRTMLFASFNRLIREQLEGRVAPFDAVAAHETAVLMGSRQLQGLPRDLRDSMIAGISITRRATLATRNVKHFNDVDIEVVNPWCA